MTDKLRAIWNSPKKRTRLICIAGIAGMILILFSELIPQKTGQTAETAVKEELSVDECETYRTSLEKQLEETVSQISGVGEVKVMITISGTEEYVYAEQSDISRQTESGGGTVKEKSEIILATENNEKQPVVRKIIAPQIGGAVVVCEGAEDVQTKERVMNAVSAALGIPSTRISIQPSG